MGHGPGSSASHPLATLAGMSERWRADHVEAMATDAAAVRAARALAVPHRWRALGADDEAVWGQCRGSGAEPYQVAVERATPAFRCSCPRRPTWYPRSSRPRRA